jgi:hypothetical protein
MKQLTGTFVMRGDDGREYDVYVYDLDGQQWLETEDGEPVRRAGDGVYLAAPNDLRLTCHDPDRP